MLVFVYVYVYVHVCVCVCVWCVCVRARARVCVCTATCKRRLLFRKDRVCRMPSIHTTPLLSLSVSLNRLRARSATLCRASRRISRDAFSITEPYSLGFAVRARVCVCVCVWTCA